MPIQTQGPLATVGDIVGPMILGNTGSGQPQDQTAVISFTGTYAAVTVAIEGVPLGQPLVQGPPQAPTSTSEWVLISSQGSLSSLGGPSTGSTVTVACGIYQQIRLRLLSITSGAIVGAIATLPFLNPAAADRNGRILQCSLLLQMQMLACLKELANKDDVEGMVTMADVVALLATPF